MPTLLSGISASVKVSGQVSTEYSPLVEPATRKASAYVESQDGAQFSVTLRNTEQLLSIRVLIDGVEQRRKIVEPGHGCKISGRRIAGGQLRPFMFTKIQLTDDDAIACSQVNIIKGLGSIVLELRRARNMRDLVDAPIYQDIPKQNTFHEKSKKAAVGENVGFGPARDTKPNRKVKVDYIDPYSGPAWSTITFHYRNADLLEAQGHKPVSIRATEAPCGRVRRADEAFGGPKEAWVLAAEDQIRELQEQLERLRKKPRVEDEEVPRVKLENPPEAFAPVLKKKTEGVIDLTLDD